MALKVAGLARLTSIRQPASCSLQSSFRAAAFGRLARPLSSSAAAFNAAIPQTFSSRVEDRLHRQRCDDAGVQVNPAAASKLKQARPHQPLNEEQRSLLTSLKRSTEAQDWQAALVVLQQIPANAGSDWLPIHRAILNCCCRSLRYSEAHSVWSQLPARDVLSYNCMLGMCSRLQRFEEVDSLIKQMDSEGIERTGVTYCQLMSSCAESQRWSEALTLLTELKSKDELDASTNWDVAYLMSMTACARAGKTDEVRTLLAEMASAGKGTVHNSHYNALIVSCGSDGAAALEVFQEMKAAGLTPRAPDWRALLTCNRDSKEQQRIYAMMRQELPTAPLEEAWAVLLRTALNTEDFDAADWIFEEMRTSGVGPESDRAMATPSLKRALRWHGIKLAQATAKAAWQQSNATSASALSSLPGGAPAVSSALPAGWASAVDPGTGREYYWRSDSPATTTTWERPLI